jgi:hypothetical protein
MTGPLALAPYPYTDYYDCMLDRRGPGVPVWRRNTRDDFPTRREQLNALACAFERFPLTGGGVPRWGIGREQHHPASGRSRVGLGERVVVYEDETMHQGLGKRLGSLAGVLGHECWAEFVPHPATGGESVRWLRVGALGFVLRYRSPGDWRSNVGTDEIKVEATTLPPSVDALCEHLMRIYKSPLLAIDLAVSYWGAMFATDLNLAPGLRGSGVEDHLRPTACAEAIKAYYYEVCADG